MSNNNGQRLNWDSTQFEANIEKEISHRKMLGALSTTKRFSEIGIADQFFLFGIPPIKKKNSIPTVLAAFPPFQQPTIPLENVFPMSMPNTDLSSDGSKSRFSGIFPLLSIDKNGPPVSSNGIIDEFVFQFNAGQTKMYGICVHVQPSRAAKTAALPFYANDNTKKNMFCFCLISKIPIFNSHFTFLHYIIALSTKSIIAAKKTPGKQGDNFRKDSVQSGNVIAGLEVRGPFGQIPQIVIPEEIQNSIIDYYSKTLFSSPEKLAPDYLIHFPPPTTSIQKLILWASLDTLFSVLPVPDIIELLTALILDAQVIIIGTSMQEVSMSVYGLFCLLIPFNYCGTVMPIVPNNDNYLDILNLPTPFIFGMPIIPKLKKMPFLESTYIVNIDKHKVPTSNFFPKYPNSKEVAQKISELINRKLRPSHSQSTINVRERRSDMSADTSKPNQNNRRSQITSPVNASKSTDKVPEIDQNDKESAPKVNFTITKPGSKAQVPDFQSIQKSSSRRSFTISQSSSEKNNSDDSSIESSKTAKNDQDGQALLDFPILRKTQVLPEIANDINPFKFPMEFTSKLNHKYVLSRETIDDILNALHEPLDFIFSENLNCFFVTNALENVTIFNQELFLCSVKPEDRAFYEFLLESQTFQDYVEAKLDEFTASKVTDGRKRRMSTTFGPKTRKRASTVKKAYNGL